MTAKDWDFQTIHPILPKTLILFSMFKKALFHHRVLSSVTITGIFFTGLLQVVSLKLSRGNIN